LCVGLIGQTSRTAVERGGEGEEVEEEEEEEEEAEEEKRKKEKCGNNMMWSEMSQDGVQRWKNKLYTRKQMEFLTQLHFYNEVGCVSGYILSVWLVLLHLHEVYTAFLTLHILV
jgi:hypothetical protein